MLPMCHVVGPGTWEAGARVPPRAAEEGAVTLTATAFSRLEPRLQHALVHTLQWRSLRPVQELAVPPILDGHNVLVLAPTAGGKTEAAVLPLLSALLPQAGRGVGALYLSPLRALLNNQEARLQRLCGMVGMSAFKWHGDVSARDKRGFSRTPADILMLTPESLEVLLLSRRYRIDELFSRLSVVVIDEIHAFAGDERGDHLLALLERLSARLSRDLQRVGLSATVGNPDTLLQWLCGTSARPATLVRPDAAGARRRVEIHAAAGEDEVDGVVRRLVRGRKSLCFSESRGQTERLKTVVESAGVRTMVHHGSLSQELRETAEGAFRDATQCCILCTSTMELGLDVGDLDIVLQVDAPPTVSALLQRWGRTGRRPGTVGHMAMVTENPWTFLQAVALVTLAMDRYVEPVQVQRRAYPVFVQQTFSRLLGHGGLPLPRVLAGEGRPVCFEAISTEDRQAILDYLLAEDVLVCLDGVVTFGTRGEQQLGRRHFEALYSVFESSQQLEVRTVDHRRIGTLDAWFAQTLRPGEFVFVLGGAAWMAVACDWSRRQLTVQPAPAGRIPSWQGGVSVMGRDLCQAMRSVLVGTAPLPFLHDAAQASLDALRDDWRPLLAGARVVLATDDQDASLYTFCGARVNYVLAKMIQRHTGRPVQVNNLWVSWRKGDVDEPLDPVYEALEAVRGLTDDTIGELVALLPPVRLSKFQDYLPPALRQKFIADRLFDREGAVLALEDGVSTVYR